jgi:hypothetical protein
MNLNAFSVASRKYFIKSGFILGHRLLASCCWPIQGQAANISGKRPAASGQ